MSDHSQFEGVGVPVYGHEENYVELFSESGRPAHISIVQLLKQAGAVAVEWCDFAACEHEWPEEAAEYRTRTGRSFPLLYRVKIQTIVEPLSEEESAALWGARQAWREGSR